MTFRLNTLEEILEVVEAFKNGEKIEIQSGTYGWHDAVPSPTWDFSTFQYRVKQLPPSIDWAQVNPAWNYLAQDPSGAAYLYKFAPETGGNMWICNDVHADDDQPLRAEAFVSFKPGKVFWKHSLVSRPGV